MLEVDLVHDALARRHHAQTLEARLSPAQEGEPLAVALMLEAQIHMARIGAAGDVDAQRVVDHEVGGDTRIDEAGITTGHGDGIAQGGEIDEQRNAQQILQQHA